MAMESKDQGPIPDIATDAVLVKSEEMPKDSKICEGKLYSLDWSSSMGVPNSRMRKNLTCYNAI